MMDLDIIFDAFDYKLRVRKIKWNAVVWFDAIPVDSKEATQVELSSEQACELAVKILEGIPGRLEKYKDKHPDSPIFNMIN